MSRFFVSAAAFAVVVLGASLGMFSLAGAAQAQVLTVRQVVSQCPDLRAASACPGVATAFLAGRSAGSQTDAQIVNLVLALADAVQNPAVTMPICLDTAEGMLVLAGGMSNPGQAQQIRDIADGLCENTQTAATGGAGGSNPPAGPPQSISQTEGNGNPTVGSTTGGSTTGGSTGGSSTGGSTTGGSTSGGSTSGGSTSGGSTSGGPTHQSSTSGGSTSGGGSSSGCIECELLQTGGSATDA